jgi:succinylarginine dihydrolase
MNEASCELNLDGLVGPTHGYAGLSYGNLASRNNRQSLSNPREAALQGLRKMKLLADLGLKQAVLPPQERPDLQALRRLGFTGTDAQVLEKANRDNPMLLAACCSASSMWAANAATVSPSADSTDGRVHFTPANLISQFHRSLESPTTAAALQAIFGDESCFVHHPALPAATTFADEGAANHTRLCTDYAAVGLQIFIYGRSALSPNETAPRKFPARQTREACEAVARLHQLDESRVLMLQQNPAAIDAGAFHNDVVAVGNLDLLLVHSAAFIDGSKSVDRICSTFWHLTGRELNVIEVTEDQIPLADAVSSYLFNSQLVRLANGTTALIAPLECQEIKSVQEFLGHLQRRSDLIRSIDFVDVRQSMRNGGGPACLRLRVALNEPQLNRVHPGVMLTSQLYQRLKDWIELHYRDRLQPADLADPKLVDETRAALNALTGILKIGSIYQFQKE